MSEIRLTDTVVAPVRLAVGMHAFFQVRGSEELAHWAKLFEQFSYSPQEFYGLVDKALDPRQIPGAGTGLVTLKEGGILSPSRLYLNIKRERLVFLLCAAPFGSGFFVSSHLLDYRSGANLLHYLIALALIFGAGFGTLVKFGFVPALFVMGLLFTLFWSLFRRAVEVGGEWLDDKLAETPVIGPIYESLFRPDTYYRRDTAEMFRQAVHNAVLAAIDEMTNQKGIRPLSDEERKPVLRNLYQR